MLYVPKIYRLYAAISPWSKIGQFIKRVTIKISKKLLAKHEKLKNNSKIVKFYGSIAP
jgi:hypothetical protein